MEYQLVLQLPESSLADYDATIELEEALVDALEDAGEVDGHDMGSGEVNFFIFTDDPEETFAKLEPLLSKRRLIASAKAAYRDVDGDDYTILYPETLENFSVA